MDKKVFKLENSYGRMLQHSDRKKMEVGEILW